MLRRQLAREKVLCQTLPKNVIASLQTSTSFQVKTTSVQYIVPVYGHTTQSQILLYFSLRTHNHIYTCCRLCRQVEKVNCKTRIICRGCACYLIGFIDFTAKACSLKVLILAVSIMEKALNMTHTNVAFFKQISFQFNSDIKNRDGRAKWNNTLFISDFGTDETQNDLK